MTQPAAASAFMRRHYVFVLMALVSGSQMADRQLLSIVMEPIKHEFSLSDTSIGFLNGTVFGVAYALGALPLAILADRWSRKKVIAVTLAFWSAMTAVTAAASSFAMLTFTRALVAFGEAGAGPAFLALLSNQYPVNKRAGMMAAVTVVTSLSAFAVFWSAGLIVEHLGWRPLFLVFGLPGVLLALVIWWTVREEAPAAAATRPTFSATDVRDVLWRAPMPQLIAATVWNGIILSALGAWIPSFLIRSHGLAIADVGFWMGLFAIMSGVLGALVGGLVADARMKRDARGGMDVSIFVLLVNLPLSIAAFGVDSRIACLVCLLLSSAAIGAASPPIGSQLLNFMPERSRATVMAIVSMIVLLVSGLGAGLTGAISDWLAARGHANGLQVALVVISCLGIFPILHLLAVRRSGGVLSESAA